ncbi:carbohydrate esterase family 16 protein [Serpula lacrymans var. lacrymans S7.3]|uniref:Carbohydrate esterase family 16 protein n=2 Tax=Serpula lacrymans var. lacrymans TaxID=341189 RepID=F8Q6Y6_SERL3|nr:carbohydrate esterase family 16 protein [Serpula lacrymans var. lacrymans S7.9]EGN96374.1 carbohydrate esterase family 16 protein [Serpula lacrymans var. lacrymans S7.3]EGO21912.1 carbohydrate esterase family 16 protein [Serpula lacrymans var. lacrymans S7.9]
MPRLQHLKIACTLLALAPLSLAKGVLPGQIKNFVTFGDSYTDIAYPAADGGQAWPVYAAGYGNFTLYPFAKSGATCSNNLTYRPFPPVFGSQIPTYLEEKSNATINPNPEETIYTLWIGTNDLGVNALLTGSDAPDVSIVQVRECAVDWLKVMYASGARNFIMQNIIPLDLTILYSNYSYPNRYWDAQRNTTEWNVYMRELAKAGNEITLLMLQALAPTLPDAHIASFDSHGLFTDMYNHPQNYLNGTAPLNVTGCVNSCIFALNESTGDAGDCTVAEGTDRDSFLWYDELHPSEQSDRIVAREITAVMKGEENQWVTWLS